MLCLPWTLNFSQWDSGRVPRLEIKVGRGLRETSLTFLTSVSFFTENKKEETKGEEIAFSGPLIC